SVDLFDVVANVHPTMLIGTSAQAGDFSERIVKEMNKHVERPIIMPLSNPTSLAEALPADLLNWTDGKALIATGSPFDPVPYNGVTYMIAQANNALVFPGIGLGVIVCRASRITDQMIADAAAAVAECTKDWSEGASLLPGIDQLRMVSAKVALAVIAAAEKAGVATEHPDDPIQAVHDAMWRPEYPAIEAV
ncbi:MAG: malic enzyme-like NAD(P)-binding protein, partial [Propionibacteriaceae bacterium]